MFVNNILDNPNTGEVRLYYDYNTPSWYRGRVEVYLSGKWGTVAVDSSWSRADGEVVCRELGFEISSKHFIYCCTPVKKFKIMDVIRYFLAFLMMHSQTLLQWSFICYDNTHNQYH